MNRIRWFAAILLVAVTAARAQDAYAAERARMVENQLAARDIRTKKVLDAMRKVPRHEFVPEPMRPYAYRDSPLPIGDGQTISQPYIVAFMSQLLEAGPSHSVLEIGTGSGYQAAVLALLVRHVFTIERNCVLAERGRAALLAQNARNVTVRCGDGYQGWPEQAPFDRIMVTAAPPEIPPALLAQLKPGGRLVAPVGDSPGSQELVLVEKNQAGKLTRRSVLAVQFVPMVPGVEERR